MAHTIQYPSSLCLNLDYICFPNTETIQYCLLCKVLGNKCAGLHNLNTVNFKETIVLGYFLRWSSALFVFFFAALYLSQDSSSELFCSDSGGDPLQALLEGALGQQAAGQL